MRSWIGLASNEPIEAEQVGTALGPTKVNDLARQTGLPRAQLLEQLARLLPTVIDRLTPQGQLPTTASVPTERR